MAVGHISFNETLYAGRQLRGVIQNLAAAIEGLRQMTGEMTQMVDGDGSSPTHFPYMTVRFGFASDAASKGAFDELNAFYAKLNTDASVTNVKTALFQVLSKFG